MKYNLDIPFTFPGGITKTFDLFVPEGAERFSTLLVWVHGGGWSSGDKRIENEFHRFYQRGYPVLALDYRLIQEAPYPAQLIDCKSAIRWIRANAAKYGIKADRIIVGGSSAGGHLAVMLGLTGNTREYDIGNDLEYSSAVDAVVDFYGPADVSVGHFAPLFGELGQKASPMYNITADAPPFLIFHGTADTAVPLSDSRRLRDALEAVNVPVTYCEVPGGKHGFDSPAVYHMLTEFILQHAK